MSYVFFLDDSGRDHQVLPREIRLGIVLPALRRGGGRPVHLLHQLRRPPPQDRHDGTYINTDQQDVSARAAE